MIEKGEELWLMLIIHIISKINDSVNIILLCTLHDQVSFIYSGFELMYHDSGNMIHFSFFMI